MADHEFTVTQLSIGVASTGPDEDRAMTITANFTTAGETWEVVLPDMSHDEIRHLLLQVERAISPEPYAASIAESENFTTELI